MQYDYMTKRVIAFQLKLLLRNKRSRGVLMFTLFITATGALSMVSPLVINNSFLTLAAGSIATSGFLLSYGTSAFSWDSQHFDCLLSSPLCFIHLVRAKSIMLVSMSLLITFFVFSFATLLFSAFYGTLIFAGSIAAIGVYNSGVLSFLVLTGAAKNTREIRLDGDVAFNYEGVDPHPSIMSALAFIAPLVLGLVVEDQFLLTICIGGAGVLSLTFAHLWEKEITRKLIEGLPDMAKSFRG